VQPIVSFFIWGHRSKSIVLGPAGSQKCPTCGQPRAFQDVLEYNLLHLYYVLGLATGKRVLRVCTVCGKGRQLDPASPEAIAAGARIPWLERFGCLGTLLGLAGAGVLFAVALWVAPTPRDVPALLASARAGDAKAIARLRSEAAADDVPSQEALVDFYMTEGPTQDWAAAFGWAKTAAGHGNARAQHSLGWMYESGKGTAVDRVQAMAWYRKAAAQGLAVSANNIGALYMQGLGVPADHREAVRWFRQAAEGGDTMACFNLAMRYLAGDGVESSPQETRRWLEKALTADGQDEVTLRLKADASYELGLLYENGSGVEKNVVKALQLYQEASSRNVEARQRLAELKAKLAR
jgi:TPR repeat protein